MIDAESVASAFGALRSQVVMGVGRSQEPIPNLPAGLSKFIPAGASREKQILLAVSALDAYRFAGACPQPLESPTAPPAPQEARPKISNRAGHLYREMLLLKQPADLHTAALQIILEAQKRLPEERLPEFMDWAARHLEEALPFLSVLGERGAWLANLNPAWEDLSRALRYFQLEPQAGLEAWETGSFVERKLLLRIFRMKGSQAPQFSEASRQMLTNTWHTDNAASRASLLAICKLGLEAGDEEILNLGLADNAREVRKTSVSLLSCLPGSVWEKRMADRAILMMNTRPSKMLRKPFIELVLPDSFSREMAADGLLEDPPSNVSLTAQAWWLFQLISYVDPGRWSGQFGRTPEQLLALASQSDWKGLLFSAWIQAARNYRSEVWAEALLRLHPGEVGLLAVLPAQKADEFIQVRLRASFVDGLALLSNHNRAWSMALTELFFNRFERFLTSEGAVVSAGPMQDRLIGMAVWMHLSGEAGLRSLAGRVRKINDRWLQTINEMLTILELRKKIEEEINHD